MESWNSVLSYITVWCQNTECCFVMIGIGNGSLETSIHFVFPSVYSSSAIFVSKLFICSSALTTLWTVDMHTSSLCFLKFRGCDML